MDAIRAAGGQAIGAAGDGTDLAAVERMRQQVEQDLGPAEVLAAFVRGGRARPEPLTDASEEDRRSTAAAFLVSDSAAWLTGVTLDVAGGYVMA